MHFSEGTGYILIHRKFLNNPLLMEKPFCKGFAWQVLLTLANRKRGYISAKNKKVVTVERGECGYSMVALADIFGWDRRTVKNFIKLLEKEKMVQQKIVENHSVIKILNYEKYQTCTTKKQPNVQQNNLENTDLSRQEIEKIVQQHVQQKINKIVQQNNLENTNLSRQEIEKIVQQKIQEDVHKQINSNTSYINISSSSSLEEKFLTEEEEELLKKHSKRNKIKYFKPWLRKLLENGDYKEIIKQEKSLQEQLQQKKKEQQQTEEERELTEEEQKQQEKEIQEIQKKIKENLKRRRQI